MVTGKKREAIAVLQRAARINKRRESGIATTVNAYVNKETEKIKMSAIFKHKELRRRTIILSTKWYECKLYLSKLAVKQRVNLF